MATKWKWLLMDTTWKHQRVKHERRNHLTNLSNNTTNKAGLIDFLSVVKLRQNNIRDKCWRWQHYRKDNYNYDNAVSVSIMLFCRSFTTDRKSINPALFVVLLLKFVRWLRRSTTETSKWCTTGTRKSTTCLLLARKMTKPGKNAFLKNNASKEHRSIPTRVQWLWHNIIKSFKREKSICWVTKEGASWKFVLRGVINQKLDMQQSSYSKRCLMENRMTV